MRKLFASVGLVLALLLSGAGVPTAPVVAAPAASGDLGTPPAMLKGAKSPKGVKALKGMYNPNQDAVNRSLLTGPYYFYGEADQTFAAGTTATTLSGNLHIYNTYLDTSMDAHTLGELAVIAGSPRNIVEVGSTNDVAVCGAGNSPCLFVYWWKNGVPQCYNGCGYVPYTPTCSVLANYCAGESLLPVAGTGVAKKFQITYSGGAWWIAYDLQWIGYFPGTLWTASTPSGPGVTFDKFTDAKGFYEVATKTTGDLTPCTDMGNGQLSSSGTAARVGSLSFASSTTPATAENFLAHADAPYTATWLSTRTIRAGGPGYNSSGGTPGNIGSC